ncbi:MAG TPA: transcriptional regulator GcvA [Methylomirabilota bacterium]|nr:transcriptional regulator GcvA [Methylomirabilota bacterium]
MPRRLPPLNALRAFEVAARHNSFTGAAAELRVSHAAVSRHVRALEARLGVTLFRKATRGVELTDAGIEYLRAISDAFDAIDAATDAIKQTQSGHIRVSVEPAFAGKWLIHRLGGFRTAYPQYDVVLDALPRLVDLHKDEADLAIRYGKGGWPGVQHDLLANSRLYPVGRPAVLGRRQQPLEPAEIHKLVLLHEDEGGLWRRWFVAAGMPDVDVTRGPRILETGLAIDAAIAGQGIALADEALVADDIASRRLAMVSDVALDDGCYYLLSLDSAQRRRSIAAFRTWLLKETAPLREST